MGLVLSAEQFFTYHDYRWVAKNMLDAGSPASLADMIDSGTTSGARIAEFIEMGEGQLFAATAIGDRYSVDDVVLYGGALARWIVANITIGPVLGRRDRAVTDEKKLSLQFELAQEYLEQLRRGERIFALVPNVPEAGLPGTATMLPLPGVNPPLITQQAVRYFGCQNPFVYGFPRPWGW